MIKMMGKAVGLTATLLILLALNWVLFTLPPGVDPSRYLTLGDQYDVRIIRDALGVPHIYGQKNTDTAFGLAYAHAEDDFATIQAVVMAGRGLNGAANGPDGAKTDYLIHLMEVWPSIDAHYDTALSDKARAIAEAYADGLNLYAARNMDKVVDYALPFTGKDVAAGFTFKTPLFYGFDDHLKELFGPEQARSLSKDGDQAFLPTTLPQPVLGSQGIAVAPSRSGDDATRLLVNSHQPLTGPVAWYEVRLHSEEGWDAAGSTFPGAPVVIHGHNRDVAWANTVNKPDLVDIYKLEINPDNENQYRFDGAWRDLEQRDADLLVKLWGPFRIKVTEPVYFSEHGPVLKVDHGAYALRWAGRHEVRGVDFMIRTNFARNMQDFKDALAMQAMPSINYVYADRDGNIAHFYNAMMPDRVEGWNWQNYLPGDRSDLIWQSYRPFDDLPRTINPPSGFVFNANNAPFVSSNGPGQPQPTDFSATMGIETHMTNRAVRLQKLLTAAATLDHDTLRRIKYDLSYDPESYAGRGLQAFLDTGLSGEDANNPDLVAGMALLQSWDLSTDRENRAAALGVMTLAPLLEHFGKKEGLDLLPAFKDSVALLKQHFGRIDPQWGEVNRHIRGSKDLAIDGGPDIVRSVYGSPVDNQGRFNNRAGDSYIMFIEWDQQGKLRSWSRHNFGSATLDKTSQHYDDQVDDFVGMTERPVPLALETLLKQSTRDYRP